MVAWADSREKSALMNHLGLVFRMSNERALGVKSYQYKERVTTVFNGYHRPLVDKNLVSQDRKASSISRSGLFFHFPPCLGLCCHKHGPRGYSTCTLPLLGCMSPHCGTKWASYGYQIIHPFPHSWVWTLLDCSQQPANINRVTSSHCSGCSHGREVILLLDVTTTTCTIPGTYSA